MDAYINNNFAPQQIQYERSFSCANIMNQGLKASNSLYSEDNCSIININVMPSMRTIELLVGDKCFKRVLKKETTKTNREQRKDEGR